MTKIDATNAHRESTFLLPDRKPLIIEEESMSKTRNERRMKAAERRAIAGIALFFILFALFCVATVRAFAMAAW